MTFGTRARLRTYEISGLIGRGGMGEVYCPRDAKLQREFVIKVLPELPASGRERVQRFDREAQTLAAEPKEHREVHAAIEFPLPVVMELVERHLTACIGHRWDAAR